MQYVDVVCCWLLVLVTVAVLLLSVTAALDFQLSLQNEHADGSDSGAVLDCSAVVCLGLLVLVAGALGCAVLLSASAALYEQWCMAAGCTASHAFQNSLLDCSAEL